LRSRNSAQNILLNAPFIASREVVFYFIVGNLKLSTCFAKEHTNHSDCHLVTVKPPFVRENGRLYAPQTRVVRGSILCDPTQPNPSAD